MKAYPIVFKPILKEKIWGGSKLRTLLKKDTNSETVGESWEISGVADNVSEIANGTYAGTTLNYLIEQYKSDFLGEENYMKFGNTFPLLIKFLDANTNLSVQVHPDDTMAKERHDSFGKTEMWYVMDHDQDAEIILGLKDHENASEVLSTINQSNVYSVFNTEKVSKGESYFIPAGKVHAIGAGVMVAEIQQTSDITYRLYDWDRTDANGLKRTLHTAEAIQATKRFDTPSKKEYSLLKNHIAELASCTYFKTNIINVRYSQRRDYSQIDSFVIFICVEGRACVSVNGHTETFTMGETLLIPANAQKVQFHSNTAKILEVYIPSSKEASFGLAS